MHINYIILAHKNPKQLERLVGRLHESWTSFFIHIDKMVDINPFLKIKGRYSNIYFLNEEERELGTWGDIGIVKGTIAGMRRVINNGKGGYCILISGQDYPLKNNILIKKFLIEGDNSSYITLYQKPGKWTKDYKIRIEKYKVNKTLNRGHFLLIPSIFEKDFYKYETLGKINFLRKEKRFKTILRIFKKRKFPKNLKPYAGGQWWAFPLDMVIKILDFINTNPNYINYHNYSLLPDEMFFHSIIMNLQQDDASCIKESLTYVNWERKSGPLPVTFEYRDFEELKIASENYLFARKFDINLDSEIIQSIDEEIINTL